MVQSSIPSPAFCCELRGRKYSQQFIGLFRDHTELLGGEDRGCPKNINPEDSFIGLLHDNSNLGNKLGFRSSTAGCPVICSN